MAVLVLRALGRISMKTGVAKLLKSMSNHSPSGGYVQVKVLG